MEVKERYISSLLAVCLLLGGEIFAKEVADQDSPKVAPLSFHLEKFEVLAWTAEEGELQKIEQAVVREIQIDPVSGQGHYILSQILARRFSHDPSNLHLLKQAADLAQQTVELLPDQDLGYVAMASMLDLMGQGEKALDLLQKLDDIGVERTWRSHFTKARLLSEREDSEQVLRLLRKSLEAPQESRDIVVPYVVAILQTSGLGDDLVEELRQWDKEFPHPTFKMNIASQLSASGKHRDAHELYQKIYQKDPRNLEAQINDAILLKEHLKLNKEAKILLQTVIKSEDADISHHVKGLVHLQLGAIELDGKRFDSAQKHFVEAFVGTPNHLASLDFISRAYKEAERPSELVTLLKHLASEGNGEGIIYAVIGETLSQELEKHRDAIKAFGDAIALDPNRSDFHNGMGLAYYRMQNLNSALQSFVKATKIDPSDATAKYNEACVLSLLGQETAALGSLEDAIALDPRLSSTARSDSDFVNIKNLDQFRQLVDGMNGSVEAIPTSANPDP